MAFKQYTFQGVAAAGAITVTGLAVGDRVVAVLGQTRGQNYYAPVVATAFESAITVVNEIQQATTGLQDYTFIVILDSLAPTAVAAAGANQGNAAALSEGLNVVSAADGTKGVVLPAAVVGKKVQVYSSVATSGLKVYPASGDDINDGTADAEITIEGKTYATFVALDSATWAAQYTANS